MLEIYNESVFDLLAGNRKALKIRQSKQRGFFGKFYTSSLRTMVEIHVLGMHLRYGYMDNGVLSE